MSNGKPRNGWKKVKTTDILSGIITGKKDVNQAEQSGEYPFFSCARETTLFSNEFLLDTDAILVSGNGSYTGFVKAYSGKFDLYQRTYALFNFKEGVNWRFIYYLFKYYFEQRYMGGTSGAAIPYITKPVLTDFEFFVPQDNSIQNEIASTLTAYDDLIENNRHRIQLLEETARLLYKEWFVQLRFPGHEHVKIIDGVPEGWERKPLGDLLTLQRGFDLPTHDRIPGSVPIYASTGVNGFHNVAKVKGPGVVTGRSGSLGTVMYVSKDHWPLNTTLWVKEFKKVTPIISVFILRALKLENYNGGVAVPTLNRNDVHKIEVLCPPDNLMREFDLQVASLFEQLEKLKEYNKKLSDARDILLPRLMNGELAV
jgi:type I restriction enzyme S subunit